jgi:hypothetical protein
MSLYHSNDVFTYFLNESSPTNQICWLLGKHVNLEWWQSYYRHGREIWFHASRGRSPEPGQGSRIGERESRTNLVAHDFPAPTEPGSAAGDVLFALGRYATKIEEIKVAARKPLVRFPVHYDRNHPDDLLVTGMRSLRGCLEVLSLRAVAELREGQMESAANDVILGLRLTRYAIEPLQFSSSPPGGPFLTAILQPLWEGLADHKWSETQIVAFDAELVQMNFIGQCQKDIKARRAKALDQIDDIQRKSKQGLGPVQGGDDETDTSWAWNEAFRLVPSGWYDQNRFGVVSLYQRLLAVLDSANGKVRDSNRAAQLQIRSLSWNPCQFLADATYDPPAMDSTLTRKRKWNWDASRVHWNGIG